MTTLTQPGDIPLPAAPAALIAEFTRTGPDAFWAARSALPALRETATALDAALAAHTRAACALILPSLP